MRRAGSSTFASLAILGGNNEMRLISLREGNVYLVQDCVPKVGLFGRQQIIKPGDFEVHLPQWKNLSRLLDWEVLGPILGIWCWGIDTLWL